MERITKQELVDTIADKWKEQYYSNSWDIEPVYNRDYSREDAYHMLLNAKTEKDVQDIIGNEFWTKNVCDECKKDCDILIVLGEPPDCESSTAAICRDCLTKAVKFVNE